MAEAGYRICACPACGSRFRVTEAQLGAAGGQVRCGACLALFDARSTLESAALAGPAPVPPTPAPAAFHPAPVPEPVASVPRPAPALSAHPEPGEIVPRRPPPPTPGYRYSRPPVAWRLVLVLLLGVGLAANVLALMADGWALRPDLRPRYQQACRLLGDWAPAAACQLPRALASFEVSEPLEVERSDPPATLVLTGRMVNQAGFAQPAPALLLRLVDGDDAPVAEHELAPEDYLATAQGAPFEPNEAADLSIRVPDPGSGAVGMTLTLL